MRKICTIDSKTVNIISMPFCTKFFKKKASEPILRLMNDYESVFWGVKQL